MVLLGTQGIIFIDSPIQFCVTVQRVSDWYAEIVEYSTGSLHIKKKHSFFNVFDIYIDFCIYRTELREN